MVTILSTIKKELAPPSSAKRILMTAYYYKPPESRVPDSSRVSGVKVEGDDCVVQVLCSTGFEARYLPSCFRRISLCASVVSWCWLLLGEIDLLVI